MFDVHDYRMTRILTFLVLTATATAAAQDRFRFFTTDNGLPNNSILAMVQASDGYLWFTTYRGMVRFDGVHFETFDSTNTPAIHGNSFATGSLFEDRQHALWAGSWNSGAIRYRDGVFTSFTTRDGLPNNRVVRIDEDAEGRIWIFTNPGLSIFENGRVKPVHMVEGESIDGYFNAPANLSGDLYLFGLWRFGRAGLERFAYGKWTQVPLPRDLRNVNALRIAIEVEDSNHRLWFSIPSRPGQAFCVNDGVLSIFPGLPAGAFASYQDRLGHLWISDKLGQVALYKGNRISPIKDLSTVLPFRVLEDRQGGIWVGTLNQGLAHHTPQVISMIRLPGGPRPNMVANIAQDGSGDIWAGGYALTRIHGGRPRELMRRELLSGWATIPEYLQHDAFSGRQPIPTASLWADPDGSLWFGDGKGVQIVRQGKLQEVDPVLRHIDSEVTAIVRDRAGSLWLGCEKGLYRYRNGKLDLFNQENGIRGEVRAIHEDKAGTLWVGTDDILCRYRNEAFSCFGDSDPLSVWPVHSMMSDADNVLWVASTRGILRIESDTLRWIQAKDGLYTNDASAILEDAQGYFWISSHLGIYRTRRSELNALAHGSTDHVTSNFFGVMDGLNVSDCAGRSQPTGLVARDGTLWFPTRDGVAVIDPKNVHSGGSPPPVRIESCFLDQAAIPCSGRIVLQPGARNLEIGYTALDLRKSDQIQFRYRLSGLDDHWLSAGTRRVAYYSQLKPGQYVFFVTAANSEGTWNPADARLEIFVEPHFYESTWFLSFGALLTLSVFALAWRLRAAQFSRRQAAQLAFAREVIKSQEGERARIAGELHDGLGQRLALIKNMALLPQGSGSPTSQLQLEEIAAEAAQALGEVRQIAHNLRPHHLDLLGLSKAISVLVKRTCDGTGILPDIVVDDLSGALQKENEIQLYRIVQECLSNIIKHSKATSVSIFIHRNEASVSLVIADNGIGFNKVHIRTTEQPRGFGLAGMAERAELVGGRLAILSSPGEGCRVTLDVPCTTRAMADQAKGDKAKTTEIKIAFADEPSAADKA